MIMTEETPMQDPFGRPFMEIDPSSGFEAMPPRESPGFLAGMRQARWALYMAVYSVPLLTIAMLLSGLLPGGNDPLSVAAPTPLTAILVGVAGLVAFIMAALRDGPSGAAGFSIWLIASFVIAVVASARAWTRPGSFLWTRFEFGGHAFRMGIRWAGVPDSPRCHADGLSELYNFIHRGKIA